MKSPIFTTRNTATSFNPLNENKMIEIVIIIAVVLLIRLMFYSDKNSLFPKDKMNENIFTSGSKKTIDIVGKSNFKLSPPKAKVILPEELDKTFAETPLMEDIDVPLEYDPVALAPEELNKLLDIDMEPDLSSDISYDEMQSVIKTVAEENTKNEQESAKLLYENENTDWVEQLSTSTNNSAKRIAGLIDLHLEKLAQPNSNVKLDDGLRGFDIGEYLY